MTRIRYKHTFLKEVIVRVDFLSEVSGLRKKLPSRIGEAIKKNYPIPETRDVTPFQINMSTSKKGNPQFEFTEWSFHSRDRNNTLTITKDAVFIKILKYSSYNVVKTDFMTAIDSLSESFEGLQAKRLGLRYINEIVIKEQKPLDWNEWLNKKYLYPLSTFPDRDALARVLNNIEFNYGSYNLRANFGIHNPDYPANIKKKIYVLDFDAYSADVLVRDDIENRLDTFHTKIENLFELFITDALRDKMG